MANNGLIRIDIEGLDTVERNLRWKMSINKRRALDEIGQYYTSEIQQRFVRSADHEGRAWERLKYRIGKPLVDTGLLRSSITHRILNGNTVEIGTNMIFSAQNKDSYAAIHNYGGYAGRGRKVKIPQREFMGISYTNEMEINEIVERHLRLVH